MLNFHPRTRMVVNTLRKISSLIDMIVAGVAIGVLVNSAAMSLEGACTMFVFTCLSFIISALADNLETEG